MSSFLNPIYRCWIMGQCAGEHFEHVFHLRLEKEGFDNRDIFEYLNRNLLSTLWKNAASDTIYHTIILMRLHPQPIVTAAQSFFWWGEWPGPSIPSREAAVVSLYTGLTGAKNRGRKFLAGVPASEVKDGVVSQAWLLKASIWWGATERVFHPEEERFPLTMGLVHRYVNHNRLLFHPSHYIPIVHTVPRPFLSSRATRKPISLFP